MNRRDFLQPRHLARTAGHVLGAVDELSSIAVEPAAEPYALLRFARRAMATSFEISLPFGIPQAQAAAEAALDQIDRLEAQLTVYCDDSEVSRINQLAGQSPVRVEDRLFELFQFAEQLSHQTDGAFDITTGALIKAWGFFRGPPAVPLPDRFKEARDQCGMRHLVLDAAERTVFSRCPRLEINLGSIGKGYALDRAAEQLGRDWDLHCGMLHGGHSSVYAMGTAPGDPRGWPIGVTHPSDPDLRLGMLWLRDRAMGTSAATFRHLEYQGKKLSHILDPRTGWPAEKLASASVLAPTAAEADALATAFYVLGVEKAREYCEAHPQVGAVLFPLERDVQPVVINIAPHEIEWLL
jgi:thiamine biosynthesis lipoprotein